MTIERLFITYGYKKLSIYMPFPAGQTLPCTHLVLLGTFTPSVVNLVVRIARDLSCKETILVEDRKISSSVTCEESLSALLSSTLEECRFRWTYRRHIQHP